LITAAGKLVEKNPQLSQSNFLFLLPPHPPLYVSCCSNSFGGECRERLRENEGKSKQMKATFGSVETDSLLNKVIK
jgi:hypothetical protein